MLSPLLSDSCRHSYLKGSLESNKTTSNPDILCHQRKLTPYKLVLLLVCLSVDQSSAGALKWPADYAGGVKSYLVNLAKTKVISNNEVLQSFNDAMERVKERYAEALESSEHKENVDTSAIYYKLVIEEMRALRERYEPMVEENGAADAEEELADESDLINELDDLEKAAMGESEMGFSLSPENKAALKERTMVVMNELLNNELRQLALAMLSAYMTGSSLAPVMAALNQAIKFKLVQYLMNVVLDILRNNFGQSIQVTPLGGEVDPATIPEARV